MAREDMVVMRTRELARLHVIRKVIKRELGQAQAGRMLRLSERQVRRLVRQVEREGDRGVVHKSRGRRSNRAYEAAVKRGVVKAYERRYPGFGPTLFAEKLEEAEGIVLGRETIRRWLTEAGMWVGARRRRAHHRWRERKSSCGEMVQIDGSHHAWLEERGPVMVLMAYVDDATNRVFARFYGYEGTIPAMESFRRYARRFGLPVSVYLDNHTTYKSTAEPSIEERLAGRRPRSQFERALEELGVTVIHAHSPQARGRVERTFRTFQDRVVKEMRLQGIASMEAANRFLSRYLCLYNRRFSRAAAGDVHRSVSTAALERALLIRTSRRVRNDGTVMHEKTLYQILEQSRPRSVVVEEWPNGQVSLIHEGHALKYRRVATAPVRTIVTKPRRRTVVRRPCVPATDHPWKRGPVVISTSTESGHF